MLLHPGILALLLGSLLSTGLLGYAAFLAVRIIRGWDLRSGSEMQLKLERQTYLVSTIMAYVMGFELISLFLFIYTVDGLNPLFIGAMCAAGTLKVNGFGYPALLVKIVSCLAAGLWLIINTVDNRAYDYPLIRVKYRMLLAIAPVIVTGSMLQAAYLLKLDPDIITSCCGILFSSDADTVVADLLALPLPAAMSAFFITVPATIALGIRVARTGRWTFLFGIATLISFLVSIAALISFVSIYIYELPTHHCPFCILHREYGYIGYLFYASLLAGTIFGLGAAALRPFRTVHSLQQIVPSFQKGLAIYAVVAFSIFLLVALYAILTSHLSMQAY